MGVTFIAPQGVYTAPAKLVSKTITENNTYNAIDDNANGYSSVTVNVEGGGGTSDFTTAEVTITNNTESEIRLALPVVRDDRRHILSANVLAAPNSSNSHIVALYKGAATGRVITDNVPSAVCTGDVSISSLNAISITGNGTITFGTAIEG